MGDQTYEAIRARERAEAEREKASAKAVSTAVAAFADFFNGRAMLSITRHRRREWRGRFGLVATRTPKTESLAVSGRALQQEFRRTLALQIESDERSVGQPQGRSSPEFLEIGQPNRFRPSDFPAQR